MKIDITLHDCERKALGELLDILDHKLSTAGCNDMRLEDTPENRNMIYCAEKWNDPAMSEEDARTFSTDDGKVFTNDFLILAYLRKKLGV